MPGLDRAASHAARMAFRPSKGPSLSARGNPAARDLVRHATMDLGGNADRARAWSQAVRRWPREQPELLDAYPRIAVPVLLLWADEDPMHPLAIAEEARDLLADAMLRVLPGTGFLHGLRRSGRAGARARGVLLVTWRRRATVTAHGRRACACRVLDRPCDGDPRGALDAADPA